MSDILNLIHQITANGESGRLEILAGAIQGELSFAEGKLVDARVGHLTGFRAINAVAAMRDARFSFDPAFTPIGSSSITKSERVVLKQFFGIETAAAHEYLEPEVVNWPEEAVPVTLVADAPEEITLVRSDAARAEIPIPLPQTPQFSPPPSRFAYRRAVAFAALIFALVAAGAVLLYKFNQPGSTTVVASVAESQSPSAPAAAQQPESPVAASTSTHSVPAPARVKTDPKTVVTARQDLSGKWNIVNTIETTSYNSFKNMKIGFNLSINQTGSTFSGKGRKVSENGRSLPAGSRTPIQVNGSIKGDMIEATFYEAGTARKSNGKFVWRIDKAGRGLNGKFATTAARSRGKSAATREM